MSHRRAACKGRVNGFTLIELLVVVAIIALLISILLPSLSRARETSRMVKCLATQKQYGNAFIMYADESNQFFVRFNGNPQPQFAQGGGFWGANTRLRQLLGFHIGGSNNTPGQGQTAPPDMICPSKPRQFIEAGHWYRSFAVNCMGSPGLYTRPNGAKNSVNQDQTIHRARITMPGTKVMGMDATNWQLTSSGQVDPVGNNNQWDFQRDEPTPQISYMAYRHLENTNMIMHDGHAETFGKGEAYDAQHTIRIRLYDPYKW